MLMHFREYLSNIELVDKGVEKLVKQMNSYYKDDQTAYVFTADHGMTSWGKVFIERAQ